MVKNKPLFVRVDWDDESDVWCATSDDVPGLATEEESFDRLVEKLRVMVPELLALNEQAFPQRQIHVEMFSRRFETVDMAGC